MEIPFTILKYGRLNNKTGGIWQVYWDLHSCETLTFGLTNWEGYTTTNINISVFDSKWPTVEVSHCNTSCMVNITFITFLILSSHKVLWDLGLTDVDLGPRWYLFETLELVQQVGETRNKRSRHITWIIITDRESQYFQFTQ